MHALDPAVSPRNMVDAPCPRAAGLQGDSQASEVQGSDVGSVTLEITQTVVFPSRVLTYKKGTCRTHTYHALKQTFQPPPWKGLLAQSMLDVLCFI